MRTIKHGDTGYWSEHVARTGAFVGQVRAKSQGRVLMTSSPFTEDHYGFSKPENVITLMLS